jgi:hypothetical protein
VQQFDGETSEKPPHSPRHLRNTQAGIGGPPGRHGAVSNDRVRLILSHPAGLPGAAAF